MRALVLLVLGGCVSTPCFTPPPTSTQEQHEILLKAAAAITAIPVTPSLETDFKNAINTTYVSLNDDNTTYFMAANLALCFAKEGKWGQGVAARILIDLEAQWKAKTGASSVDQHPQADQVRAIQKAVSSDK
jgi:hypothetical protein